MTLLLLLESLKFYKVRHERTIQIWFVLLYALNVLVFLIPAGDRDFSRLFAVMDEMMNGRLPTVPAWDLLSPGNFLVLGISLAASLITIFFGWMYAVLMVGEADAMTPGQVFSRCLKALPALVLFAVLLLVPAMLSVLLAFIPLLIFLLMMYFLPLNLTIQKQNLVQAIQASYEATSHKKFMIFLQVVLLSFIISLPQNLILNLAPIGGLPYVLIMSFFIVLRALVFGRLMGLLYLFMVKKVPIVIKKKDKQ